jgi:TRAP-type C4-dicarboxylate transport system substrate-binding protein
MLRKKLLVLFVLSIVSFCFTASTHAKTLRVQIAYPEASSVSDNAKFFAKKVAEYTQEDINIKLYYPGQLVKAGEALTAMRRGMIDGYIGSGLYFSGSIPEVNGEWLPYSWRNVNEMLDIYYSYGYLDIMRKAFEKNDAIYVAPISVATMGLMTKFPINSVEDLKGKKIRASGMEAKIVEMLGASSVNLEGAEQYSALQRGTVDGTDYPWYTLEDYNFYEVVDYISNPALHTPGVVEITLSKKTWDNLSENHKDAINHAGWNTAIHSARLQIDNDEQAYKFAEEKGIKNIVLSEKELSSFKKRTNPLYSEHMKESELCADQVRILGEYFQKQGIKHPSVEAITD